MSITCVSIIAVWLYKLLTPVTSALYHIAAAAMETPRWADVVDSIDDDDMIFTITIKHIETFMTNTVQLNAISLVQNLKHYIMRIWGIPVEQQKIIYKNIVWANHEPLCSYCHTNNLTVYVGTTSTTTYQAPLDERSAYDDHDNEALTIAVGVGIDRV